MILGNSAKSGERWLKAELHAHCSLDPHDYRMCAHSPEELIREAARLSYEVLAITCHDLDVWSHRNQETVDAYFHQLIVSGWRALARLASGAV